MLRDKVLARPRALQAMTFTSASVFAALALIVTIEAIRSLAAACGPDRTMARSQPLCETGASSRRSVLGACPRCVRTVRVRCA